MTEVAEAGAAKEFNRRVDHLLQSTCEVARAMVGAHQVATGMLVAVIEAV